VSFAAKAVDIFLLHSRARRIWRTEGLLDKQERLARSVSVSCDYQATLANIASDKRASKELRRHVVQTGNNCSLL
jgi:hypothetical protein